MNFTCPDCYHQAHPTKTEKHSGTYGSQELVLEWDCKNCEEHEFHIDKKPDCNLCEMSDEE